MNTRQTPHSHADNSPKSPREVELEEQLALSKADYLEMRQVWKDGMDLIKELRDKLEAAEKALRMAREALKMMDHKYRDFALEELKENFPDAPVKVREAIFVIDKVLEGKG